LLMRCNKDDQPTQQTHLWHLHSRCSHPQAVERPLFAEIQACLEDCAGW